MSAAKLRGRGRSRITAHAPAWMLLEKLRAAGWSSMLRGREHHGRVAVLAALVSLLPVSGQGPVTETAIADRANYSLRWTRECLHWLEDQGLIQAWRRGGIVGGQRTKSWLRVSRRFLADLIRVARGEKDLRMAKQAAQTEARTAGIWNAKRNRRSGHAALPADLPPLRGSSTRPAAPSAPAAAPDCPCPHDEPRGERYCALCRRGIAA